MTAARLICLGDVIVDMAMYLPALPPRGGDVFADRIETRAGGCGFNVMVAAARQGVTAGYAGGHGTGPLGDLCRAALLAEGIATLQPVVDDEDTGMTVALIEADGERTFVTTVGAEGRIDDGSLRGLQVRDGDVVYLAGYDLCYPRTGPALARWLPTLPPRVLVITDPGPVVAQIPHGVLAPVAARTDWWLCNEAEAAALTGRREPAESAAALAGDYARAGALVRAGADGCYLAERGRPVEHLPGVAVDVVDTNGAGDTHTGVFLAGLLTRQDPSRAARTANLAAALSVTRRGAASAPTAAEIAAAELHE